MSDDISYHLGYLNGRIKAHEGEEALKELVIKAKGLKPKQTDSPVGNAKIIKDKNDRYIIL